MRTLTIREVDVLVREKMLALGACGVTAEVIANCLLWAEVRGNSQGLAKLPSIVGDPSIRTPASHAVLEGTGAVRWLNATGMHAMPAVVRALIEGEAIAKEYGGAFIAVRGTASSSGALGYYTEMGARKGYVTVLISSTIPLVAPHGGIGKRVVGTNPISIAIPAQQPIVLDVSTSALSYFAILRAKELGELLPEGVVINAEGGTCTDPQEFLSGNAALTPKAGELGWGIGSMIQVLGGIIAGSGQWGHLLMMIDPTALGKNLGEIEEEISRFAESVHAAQGFLPGERSWLRARNAQTISVSNAIFSLLTE